MYCNSVFFLVRLLIISKFILKVFLYSNKHNRFLNVDIDKIPDLQEEGLRLGVRGTENGVKLLKRAITERKRKLEDSEQSL